MVNYSDDVNVLANEVEGKERLPDDTGHSLGPFQSFVCLLTDPTSHELEVLFTNLFDERIWTVIL